eukprot:1158542-Pelagomonas_calceolata.AAC.2
MKAAASLGKPTLASIPGYPTARGTLRRVGSFGSAGSTANLPATLANLATHVPTANTTALTAFTADPTATLAPPANPPASSATIGVCLLRLPTSLPTPHAPTANPSSMPAMRAMPAPSAPTTNTPTVPTAMRAPTAPTVMRAPTANTPATFYSTSVILFLFKNNIVCKSLVWKEVKMVQARPVAGSSGLRFPSISKRRICTVTS